LGISFADGMAVEALCRPVIDETIRRIS
jgi:hypothetical protein